MLADGEWQPVAAQAGAVVLPPFVVQVPLSGSTESTIQNIIVYLLLLLLKNVFLVEFSSQYCQKMALLK